MARTHRSPDGVWANGGAVAQHDGKLPIYICNDCGREVVWATSARTGRKYLANISRGANGFRFYIGANIHQCSSGQPTGMALDFEIVREIENAEQYEAFCAEQYAASVECTASHTHSSAWCSGQQGDFNESWARMKNEAAQQEREQEAAAFMAKSLRW